MRKMSLIRYGVACALLGGGVVGGMFAAGCGGDDSTGNNNNGGTDSGTDVTQPPATSDRRFRQTTSTGDKDAGDAGDSGPIVPEQGKLILVHASAYAPALRFCFGFVNGDAGAITIPKIAAAPNTDQGLPPGLGGAAAKAASDLQSRTITIFGINAAKLAGQNADAGTSELTCDKLINTDGTVVGTDAGGLGLQPGVDYWNLGTLPAGTIADGTTTLAAVIGCVPGMVTSALDDCPALPGADGGTAAYDPAKGNLSLWVKKLDNTTAVDGGAIGAQFAYASYPFSTASTLYGGAAAVAGFLTTTLVTPDAGTGETDAGDAGGDAGDAAVEAAAPTPPVTTRVPDHLGRSVRSAGPTALASVPGVNYDGTSSFFVSAVTADGGPTPLQLALPLPKIQALSAPGLATPEFANGNGYVFILVGDPRLSSFLAADGGVATADSGSFNPLSAHILGFPVNPPFGQ